MRILFTALAVPTHVLPMVPFAWACRSAGHDVRFAVPPEATGTVTGAGLQAVAVGEPYDIDAATIAFVRSLAAGPPTTPLRTTPWITAAEVAAADLVAFAEDWGPDVVVTDPMAYAAPLVTERLGVPLVRHLWGPDWMACGYGMGGVAPGGSVPPWPARLRDLYAAYGARTGIDFARLTLDPFPPGLAEPGSGDRISVRHVPHNGSAVAPAWLARAGDRPRVCVTWGTTTAKFLGPDGFLVPRVLAALADLDVEPVLAIRSAEVTALGPLPAGTRVTQLPLDVLLPTCSAIVHPAGAGAMGSAAAHGVPQVVVPQLADAFVNARLLAATGAGLRLDAAGLTSGDIRSAVFDALTGVAVRDAAAQLRKEIRALPTPAAVVAELERTAPWFTPA